MSREEFELELGISLEKLYKLLNQEPIYIKLGKEIIKKNHVMIENRFNNYLIYDKEWIIYLKDYKKTWAFNSEDLK